MQDSALQNQLAQKQSLKGSNQENKNYDHIHRTSNQSLKYRLALIDKTICQLDSTKSPQSLQNMPIVCSLADMDFRLCPKIQQQLIRYMSNPQIVLGYTNITRQQSSLIFTRMKSRYLTISNPQSQRLNQQPNNLVIGLNSLKCFNSMLSFYYLVITTLTEKNEEVLIFTPTYYRFMYTLKEQKRKIVQYELKQRELQDQGSEFWIDFDELQISCFKNHKIKLIVWANPHNPSGRVWKSDQLQKLIKLVRKYDCLIFSDDIFCQTIPQAEISNPKIYTSLLNYPEIYPNLIWASAFGKAFNCSGNSFQYSIIPNPKIRSILQQYMIKIVLFPTVTAIQLMKSCFTVGDDWRIKTIEYIRENFILLKEQFKQRQIKIKVMNLDSGFLSVWNFSKYKWSHTQLKSKLENQNIFVTYFDHCYSNKDIESINIVRVNLAINRKVLLEMINRVEKMLKFKQGSAD